MSQSDFVKCHMIHAINAWTNIIAVKTNITSLDKYVIILMSSGL